MVVYLDVGAVINCNPPPDECFVTSAALDILELRIRFAIDKFVRHGKDVTRSVYMLQSAYGSRAKRRLTELLDILARQGASFSISILFQAVAVVASVDMRKPAIVDALETILPKKGRTTPVKLVKILYNYMLTRNSQSLATSLRRFFETYVETVLGCVIVPTDAYKEVRREVETALKNVHQVDMEDVVQVYSIVKHMLSLDVSYAKVYSPDAEFADAIRIAKETLQPAASLSIEHVRCS
ncbi:MAG: hypothetical protein ABWK05_02895 [Pyrobaculum sp.]